MPPAHTAASAFVPAAPPSSGLRKRNAFPYIRPEWPFARVSGRSRHTSPGFLTEAAGLLCSQVPARQPGGGIKFSNGLEDKGVVLQTVKQRTNVILYPHGLA